MSGSVARLASWRAADAYARAIVGCRARGARRADTVRRLWVSRDIAAPPAVVLVPSFVLLYTLYQRNLLDDTSAPSREPGGADGIARARASRSSSGE